MTDNQGFRQSLQRHDCVSNLNLIQYNKHEWLVIPFYNMRVGACSARCVP